MASEATGDDLGEVQVTRIPRPVEGGLEHIESLGRTNLMAWSPEEFGTLIEVIVTAFTDHLRQLGDDPGEVPYP